MTTARSPYSEATQTGLTVVGICRETGREVRMRADAAASLGGLLARARAAGVAIVPVSGFRTFKYQESLFYKAVEKYGSEDVAARWVARPGHSEHHTGLAVDLGDESSPECDIEPPFEGTGAFHWLCQNAGCFGFELSFPRNNACGVDYEPWHWRFVGTPEAKQVFHK